MFLTSVSVDLSDNTFNAIVIVCIAFIVLYRMGSERTTMHDATIAAWEAWEEVSKEALENDKPVPPIPHEPKR